MERISYNEMWKALLRISVKYGAQRADMALDDLIRVGAFDNQGVWLPRQKCGES